MEKLTQKDPIRADSKNAAPADINAQHTQRLHGHITAPPPTQHMWEAVPICRVRPMRELKHIPIGKNRVILFSRV